MLHDRWRILAELGRGGMGEVYLADHIAAGRKEAVKILMASLARDPQFVARFRREARAVNRLRHPNIVAIYDFGRLEDGRFYLAMEYADGPSILQLQRRERVLAVPRTLHLLGQLAYAVHHAHSRDVVHRDLKPGNLMVVGPDETLKVLDFGMAKIVAPDLAESAQLSSTNVIWGTPRYMAPERAMGIGDDPRSDLYSIGCIAYELVVGAPLFIGDSNAVLHAHVTREPPVPSTARPEAGIPPELDAVVTRCLAKKPNERFQTAAELYAALRRVPGYPQPKTDRRRHFVPVERAPDQLPPQPAEYGLARGALRQLAEAMLDAGAITTRLVTGVAYLRDNEQTLARCEAAQDALEHEAEAVRETVGDRERTLRFARGELQLAAESVPAPELDDALRELETRLAAAAADADRLRALEQGLASVCALRTTSLDAVKGAYDALERVVDDLLPTYGSHPSVEPLAHKLALVRQRRYSDREG
ncbi:MAG TPA: serine/threonine-protein kinase [Kofleriaceae bacterium]